MAAFSLNNGLNSGAEISAILPYLTLARNKSATRSLLDSWAETDGLEDIFVWQKTWKYT